MLNQTCKNLHERLILELDGQLVQLPRLQGIVILNINSYMGGTNFVCCSFQDKRNERDGWVCVALDLIVMFSLFLVSVNKQWGSKVRLVRGPLHVPSLLILIFPPQSERRFRDPAMDDGLLEIVAVKGSTQVCLDSI